MKGSNYLYKTYEDHEHAWIWNGKSLEILGRSKVITLEKEFDFKPDVQKTFADTTRVFVKTLSDVFKKYIWEILKTVEYENKNPKAGKTIRML